MSGSRVKKEAVLRKPDLFAAWPGVQNVALSAAEFMRGKLNAKNLLEADLREYFSPSGVSIQKGRVINPTFPGNNFYYLEIPDSDKDLVIFIGDDQPDLYVYEFAHRVLDIAKRFNVGRVYTAAAYVREGMHIEEKPRVWGASTRVADSNLLKKYDIPVMEKGQVAGMNGLILGAAKERRIPAMCLLTEVPNFTVPYTNLRASCAILEKIKGLLQLNLELTELENLASQVEEEISKAS
ncbi:MAG: PAC2 family protein, partial [Dehalococcoidia bacterium]|nr:PAC2 family protein [Dehalococcoidia bacterium]